MASDHRKLRVFHEAHRLTLAIYKHTKNFPKEEWYGLRAQIRKAAVSIPTNIVEGSARRSTREYLNFLNIARASGAEVAYLVQLTYALEILSKSSFAVLDQLCVQLVPQLEALVEVLKNCGSRNERRDALRSPAVEGLSREPRAQSQEPREPEAQSLTPRAQSLEPRAKSQEPKARTEPKA